MKKQVVVIEDDEAINDILTIMLTNDGYLVSSITVGQFFDTCQVIKPDLFLIDRHLSEIDGLEICGQIKAHSRMTDIPVIVITRSDFLQSSYDAGADACITKPFSRQEFISTVYRCINRGR